MMMKIFRRKKIKSEFSKMKSALNKSAALHDIMINFLTNQPTLNPICMQRLIKGDFIFYFNFYTIALGSFNNMIREILDSQTYKLKDNISFEDGDIVLDIGANLGMYSIYLAKQYPNIKIYAFEPVKQNFALLEENIKLNNVTNIIPIKKALGTYNGVTNVSSFSPLSNWGMSTHDSDIAKFRTHYVNVIDNKEEEVELITLDAIFEELNISKCKHLKLDCEGGEKNLLDTTSLDKVEYLTVGTHFDPRTEKRIIHKCLRHINKDKFETMRG